MLRKGAEWKRRAHCTVCLSLLLSLSLLLASALLPSAGAEVSPATEGKCTAGSVAVHFVSTLAQSYEEEDPHGVAVMPDGSKAVVADGGNHKILLVDMATGAVDVLAGSGTQGFQDGSAGSATFRRPTGVAVTPDGSKVVVTEYWSHQIRLIDMATKTVSTLAGRGGIGGDSDGSRRGSRFRNPQGVSVTPNGSTAVVADSGNHKIRLVNISTGEVRTLAGSGAEGSRDGAAGSASFRNPSDVEVTPDGSKAVVADGDNNKIRLVDMATGVVSTLAGSGAQGYRDGAAGSAMFDSPDFVTVTTDGSQAVVSDRFNDKIRLVDMATGAVTTLAGSVADWYDSNGGAQDGVATSATITRPLGVATTPDGKKAVVTHGAQCYFDSCRKIRLVDLKPTCVVCEVLFWNQLCPCWVSRTVESQIVQALKSQIVQTLNVREG